jgi:hypothetical protein
MSSMSSSRFGKRSSARFRPRAEQASIQIIPLSSSRTPLRMVSRSQPNSRSALRCPPLPIARTVRAINRRRALPFSSLAVSIKSNLTSRVSSIVPLPDIVIYMQHLIIWEVLFLASPLEIITVFSARLYGSRSHKNKKLAEKLRDTAEEIVG